MKKHANIFIYNHNFENRAFKVNKGVFINANPTQDCGMVSAIKWHANIINVKQIRYEIKDDTSLLILPITYNNTNPITNITTILGLKIEWVIKFLCTKS